MLGNCVKMTEYDAKALAQDLSKGMGVKKLKDKYGVDALEKAGLGNMKRNWAYSYRGENLARLENSVKIADDKEGLEGILDAVRSMNPSKRVVQYETVQRGLDVLSCTLEDYIRTSYDEDSIDDDVDDDELERAMKDLYADPYFEKHVPTAYVDINVTELPEPESLPKGAVQTLDESDALSSFEDYSTDQDLLSTEDLSDAGETLRSSIEQVAAYEHEEPSLDIDVDDPDSFWGDEPEDTLTSEDGLGELTALDEVVENFDEDYIAPVSAIMPRTDEQRIEDCIDRDVDDLIFRLNVADDPDAYLSDRLEGIKRNSHSEQYLATLSRKLNDNADLFPDRKGLIGAISYLDGRGDFNVDTGLQLINPVIPIKKPGWGRTLGAAAGIILLGVCAYVVAEVIQKGIDNFIEMYTSTEYKVETQQRLVEINGLRNAAPGNALIEIKDDAQALAQAVQETTQEILEAKPFWDETLPTVVGVKDKSVTDNVENHDYVIIDKDGGLRLPSQVLAMNLNVVPMGTNDSTGGCSLPRMLIPQGDGSHACGDEEQIHHHYNKQRLEKSIDEMFWRAAQAINGDALADSETAPEKVF
jgi:hypothetical protein